MWMGTNSGDGGQDRPRALRRSSRTAGRGPRLRARRRIVSFGAVTAALILTITFLATRPLSSALSEQRQTDQDGAVLRQAVELRTTVAEWQIYIEPRFAKFSTGPATLDPTEIAQGSQLATTLQAQANSLVAALHDLGLPMIAEDVDAANRSLMTAITTLGQLAAGRPVKVILAATTAERAAYARVWSAMAAALGAVDDVRATDAHEAADHLDHGWLSFVLFGVGSSMLVLVSSVIVGIRARRRERTARDQDEHRVFETEVQQALEMSRSEQDVYRVVGRALQVALPESDVEMLVADSSRAHFHRTLSVPEDRTRDGCGVVSPLDCPATVRGHALEFPSSRALHACPYLQGRASGDCSAVCVPLSITGRAVGVVHATGEDGIVPSTSQVRHVETVSRRASERLAMLRAFERSETQARTDPLTGLLNRRSLENFVRDLRVERDGYVLAYADLDQFKQLNDTHGHETGDQALRLFSRVMRDSVRPDDLVARYGGEEFLVVLPDCPVQAAVAVLERVQERLALALTSGRVPSFTVSFGVASAGPGDAFDEIVADADTALLEAKRTGRNRVVVATTPDLPPAPARAPVQVGPDIDGEGRD